MTQREKVRAWLCGRDAPSDALHFQGRTAYSYATAIATITGYGRNETILVLIDEKVATPTTRNHLALVLEEAARWGHKVRHVPQKGQDPNGEQLGFVLGG